jgi:hypothetical protein
MALDLVVRWQYGDRLLDAMRCAAERCDSLQSFFLMHSLGGGTGSGLGTYILQLLEDNFEVGHMLEGPLSVWGRAGGRRYETSPLVSLSLAHL